MFKFDRSVEVIWDKVEGLGPRVPPKAGPRTGFGRTGWYGRAEARRIWPKLTRPTGRTPFLRNGISSTGRVCLTVGLPEANQRAVFPDGGRPLCPSTSSGPARPMEPHRPSRPSVWIVSPSEKQN